MRTEGLSINLATVREQWGLRAAILVEIAVDRIPERDDPENLAGLRCSLRVQRFHRAAQFRQICADARVLVDRLDRTVEEAVRCARRLGNLLAAHGGELVDLLAEFRAVGVECRQFLDELIDALVELARFFRLQGNEARSLAGRNWVERFRRIELQLRRGLGLGGRIRGHVKVLVLRLEAAGQGGRLPLATQAASSSFGVL